MTRLLFGLAAAPIVVPCVLLAAAVLLAARVAGVDSRVPPEDENERE